MAILNCVVKRGVVVVGLVGIGSHVAVILEMGMALEKDRMIVRTGSFAASDERMH